MGNLYRDGRCFYTKAVRVYDHDYEYLAEGKVIPHGIYDLNANKGYISIGGSSETADFIVDNLFWWWWEYGIHQYPDAKNILLLCDSGGGILTGTLSLNTGFRNSLRKQDYRSLFAIIPRIAPSGIPLNTDYSVRFTRQWKEWY